MKYVRILASLLAVVMLAAACSEDQDEILVPEQEETMATYTLTADVAPTSRVVYTDENDQMDCRWKIGDLVTVSNGTESYRFDVTEVSNAGSAKLTYYGTTIRGAENFVGTATYIGKVPSDCAEQAVNGTIEGDKIIGKGNATAHLPKGEVLTAEVRGLTNNPRLTFRHSETSVYRILIQSPTTFSYDDKASLTMKIGDKENELKLAFGVEKDKTIVAYMQGGEATLPAGGSLEFVLRVGHTDYVYTVSPRSTEPINYGVANFWLADLRPFTPESYSIIRMEELTLEDKVGQMFIVRPEQLVIDGSLNSSQQHGGYGITSLSGTDESKVEEGLNKYPVGGVILFAANISSKTHLMDLISRYKQMSKYYPFIAVDEEGGRVARVANSGIMSVPKYTSMTDLAKNGVDAVSTASNTIGAYLEELGFNLNFAPVADVNSNPNNIVIGQRAFSDNPNTVATMVSAYIDGMHNHNILSTLKHFPGHGDTKSDTHADYTAVTKTWAQMLKCEIIPFAQNKDKTDFIMTAHISATKVNETASNGKVLPSTMSYEMITNKLRKELGYDGIVVTDGMEMGAITKNYTPGVAAVTSIAAGCDIILAPLDLPEAYNAVLEKAKTDAAFRARIDESVKRILAKKNRMK